MCEREWKACGNCRWSSDLFLRWTSAAWRGKALCGWVFHWGKEATKQQSQKGGKEKMHRLFHLTVGYLKAWWWCCCCAAF